MIIPGSQAIQSENHSFARMNSTGIVTAISQYH